MGKYYLTTTYSGHFKTLKVKYSNDLNGNWDEYMWIDAPKNDKSNKKKAEIWRDDVINAICSASQMHNAHMGSKANTLNPSDFINFRKDFDNQH